MTPDEAHAWLDALLKRSPALTIDESNEIKRFNGAPAFEWHMLGADIEHAFVWLYARADKNAYPGPMYRRAWLLLIFFVIPSMLIPATLIIPMEAGVLYPVAIFAPLSVTIITTRLIANRSSSPTARSKRGECRACGYKLRGLGNAIVFPPKVEDPPGSGPEQCPECGRRWPLLV